MHAKARRTFAYRLIAFGAAAHLSKLFLRAGKSSGKKGCDAVRKLSRADLGERLIRSIAEIGSAASMGMDVDKAGKKRKPGGIYDPISGERLNVSADSDNAPSLHANGCDSEIASRSHNPCTRNKKHCYLTK
jgi:hypothetical protein